MTGSEINARASNFNGVKKNQKITIEPGRQKLLEQIRELYLYRELFLFLAWRDVSVRYKQALLGAAWVVLQPVIAMIISTLLFSRMLGMDSLGLPYPVFVLAGIIPWNFFSEAIKRSSDSIISNSALITKVYFPRTIIPGAAALSVVVDFAISLFVLFAVIFFYWIVQGTAISPGPAIAALPLLFLLLFVAALSFGSLFAAVNVRFRDVKYTIGFILQMWMFASPVFYPYKKLADQFPLLGDLLLLNPLAGIVEGFRWSLLGTPFPARPLAVSLVVCVFMFFLSGAYFRRVERTFADVI